MASQVSTTDPIPDGPAGGNQAPVPSEELIAGIQLLRAANLQTVRLQLALSRQERRSAMESLDRLADMDRELERFLVGLEPAAPALDEINRLVAMQKSALANEKVALMAEISGPRLSSARPLPSLTDAIGPPDEAPGPEPVKEEPPKIIAATADGAMRMPMLRAEPDGSRWTTFAAVTILLILAVAGGAAAWLAYAQPERAAELWQTGAAMLARLLATASDAVSDLVERLPLP